MASFSTIKHCLLKLADNFVIRSAAAVLAARATPNRVTRVEIPPIFLTANQRLKR
jgi:hypothetical protein